MDDLSTLRDLLEQKEPEEDWAYLFRVLYVHACLKGNKHIADWFQNVAFPMLDPIQQIALRQIFSYGRYLLQRAKN